MEGTLSLLDWRPASVAEAQSAASIEAARIVVFDCETTGTDRNQDQIIELCVQLGIQGDAPQGVKIWRVKPSVPIHPGAQAVHGITLAELEDCPSFGAIADEVAAVFADADVIVGYNIAFDIDMLVAEYARIGRPPPDLHAKHVVDALRLWQQCEPRSLQHAHQRFVGNQFPSAHSARADVAATARVLAGMLKHFKLDDRDWSQIATFCDPERSTWVGPTRHLRWVDEVMVIGFGKHANTPVHVLASSQERSFLAWVIERDFPDHVREVCRAALALPAEQFLIWARERF